MNLFSRYVCRQARNSYFQGGNLPAVLEGATDDSWKKLLFRGTDGADTPVFVFVLRNSGKNHYIKRRLRDGSHVTIPALTVLSKEEKIELLVQQELYVREPFYDNLLTKGKVFKQLFEINNLEPTEERLRQLRQLGASKEMPKVIFQITRRTDLVGLRVRNSFQAVQQAITAELLAVRRMIGL